MASGTISLIQITTTGSIVVRFDPADDFDSGVLTVENTRTGTVVTSVVTEGSNTIANLDGATRYIVYVESYDDTTVYLGTSNHLLVTTPSMMNGSAWPVVETQWRTDRIDWQTVYSSLGDDQRITLPVNSRGYWYQQKMRCTEQNARIVLYGIKLNMRVKGRGEEARSG